MPQEFQTGKKPDTVLMIHAYPLSAAMWEQQEKALQDAGKQVIAPHLPGFGGTSGTMQSLPETAQQLLDLLPAEPISLVGLSMGGYLALELLAQAPERFARVVLADTSADVDSEEKRKDRESQAGRVLIEGRQFIIDAAEKEHSAATFTTIKPMIEAASREGIASALRAIASRNDHRSTLEALRIPLLVLVGEQDEITPPADARELARLGHGELRVIPEAGHLSQIDQPQKFNDELLQFLT